MTQIEAIMLMESSASAGEWNANCSRVKREFGGYPEWWYPTIVLSGLADKTAAKWGGDAQIHVTFVEPAEP